MLEGLNLGIGTIIFVVDKSSININSIIFAVGKSPIDIMEPILLKKSHKNYNENSR